MSAIYFVRFGDYVKIGFASNPTRRVKILLQQGSRLICPDDLDRGLAPDLLLVIPFCRQRDERNMHMLFGNHWVVGEWYRWSPAFRYQMQTMQFVTHATRLRDFARARRALGIQGAGGSACKEWHGGKTAAEHLAELHGRAS